MGKRGVGPGAKGGAIGATLSRCSRAEYLVGGGGPEETLLGGSGLMTTVICGGAFIGADTVQVGEVGCPTVTGGTKPGGGGSRSPSDVTELHWPGGGAVIELRCPRGSSKFSNVKSTSDCLRERTASELVGG